jgi:putative ABC transport system permease protein
MSLWQLVIRSAWRLRGRYAALAALLVLGGGVVSVGACLGAYSGKSSAAEVDGGALRSITVYGDAATLTSRELRRIQAIPGVTSATPVVATPVGLKESGSSLTLVGWNPSAAPPMVQGPDGTEPAEAEVVLPATADGMDLRPLLGRMVQLTYTVAVTTSSGTTRDISLRVVGLSDPTYQVDGPLTAYASLPVVTRLAAARAGVPVNVFGASHGYDKVLVVASSRQDVALVLESLQGQGFHAVSVLQELDALPGVIALIRMVTVALFAALALVGIIAAVAVTLTLCRQRAADVAVLKAYGWQRGRIQAVLTAEVGIVCGSGLAAGLLAGLGTARLLDPWFRDRLTGAALGQQHMPLSQLLLGGGLTLLALLLAVTAAVGRANRPSVMDILRRV